MTPEAKVKKEIRDYIDSLPMVHRIPIITMGYGKSGNPDDVVCYKGLFFAPEIKAKGKHTTPWQDQMLYNICKAGGIAGICWSLEDAKNLFENGIGWLPEAIGKKQYFQKKYHH